MVTGIVPSGAGVSALGLDPRLARPGMGGAQGQGETRLGDRVDISGVSLAAVRQSVNAALEQAHQALAVGHDAQAMLVKAQAIVRAGGPEAQAELTALLNVFAARTEDAIAQGARLVAGESVPVQAEPGGTPLILDGVDLQLKNAPQDKDILAISRNARADDPDLPQALQRSLEALQTSMTRLMEASQALQAHQGFLGAAEGAVSGVRNDLDAEGARLLALQVRQGLQSVGAGPIANVEPQAVLALFRA